MDSTLALLIQVLAGVSLAACCGLRAFLPLFVIGLAVRLGLVELVLEQPIQLNPSFGWLASTPALMIFGLAVVLEMAADKVPLVDHVLDVVETVLRPLSGMLVVTASLAGLDPLPAAVIGLIVGGSVAGSVHLAKSKIRLLSTLGTGGLASPILSLLEDFLALAGSVLAVFASVIAALLIVLGIAFTARTVQRYLRRVRSLEEEAGPPHA